jgi:hypothetical protein
METVEIFVYFTVAFIVGTLFLAFLTGLVDTGPLLRGLTCLMIPGECEPDVPSVETVTVDDFAKFAHDCWKECGSGSLDKYCGTRNVEDPKIKNLNKTSLFNVYKKLNWCYSIQCASCGCGSGEDVEMEDYELPYLAMVECKGGNLKIS